MFQGKPTGGGFHRVFLEVLHRCVEKNSNKNHVIINVGMVCVYVWCVCVCMSFSTCISVKDIL